MSEQQRKILELLARGLPNEAIANDLGITPTMIMNQLTLVFGGLGVSDHTQAAIAARALLKNEPSSPIHGSSSSGSSAPKTRRSFIETEGWPQVMVPWPVRTSRCTMVLRGMTAVPIGVPDNVHNYFSRHAGVMPAS